ncbi:MAG: hypothetical protein FWF75_03190 [Propionibacteriaceae bacterium]|nr:hypothetical protein [Propionibacteriaceae bacterium]
MSVDRSPDAFDGMSQAGSVEPDDVPRIPERMGDIHADYAPFISVMMAVLVLGACIGHAAPAWLACVVVPVAAVGVVARVLTRPGARVRGQTVWFLWVWRLLLWLVPLGLLIGLGFYLGNF